jgi:hypothetical protein
LCLALEEDELMLNYPFTVIDYSFNSLAATASDDRVYIAELSDPRFTPLEMCVVNFEDEECSTETKSPNCVKNGLAYIIRVQTGTYQGYLGVVDGWIQVVSAYKDASFFRLVRDGDKVRISHSDSEETFVSIAPGIPVGIQTPKEEYNELFMINPPRGQIHESCH